MCKGLETYQVADNNFALSERAGGLALSTLGGSTTGSGLRLVNTTSGRSGSAASGSTLGAAVASALAAGRDDVVEGLIKLSRHDDGWGKTVGAGKWCVEGER